MKKSFITPEMEIELFRKRMDIICSSGFGGMPGNDSNEEIEPSDDSGGDNGESTN